jgi:hypothetical protein
MCFKIKLKSALNNAFIFSFDARRISVMFSVIAIAGFAIFFSILTFAYYRPTDTIPFGKMAQIVPNYAGNLALLLILFTAILALSALLSVLIKGAFIHNYTIRDSKAGIARSIDALGGRMAPLINLTIIIFLVSMLLDSLPVFGGIANLLFALAVFFAYQEVIIAKKGAIASIDGSLSILKTNWKDILVSIVAVIASTFIIISVFLIPLLAALFVTLAGLPAQAFVGINFAPAFSAAVSRNILSFIVGGAVLAIGLAAANLFSIGFITDVYLQLAGKKSNAVESLNVLNPLKKSAKKTRVKKKSRRKK